MILISLLILILAIALTSISNKISPQNFIRITALILIYSFILTLNTYDYSLIGTGLGIYNGLYHTSVLTQYFDLILYLTASLILLAWPVMINSTESLVRFGVARKYSIIILFSTIGASLLISSSNLISMYLSIELQSFAIYLLASIYQSSKSATSAGMKYFLLGCLASCLILLGSALIYSFTGIMQWESIYSFINITSINNTIPTNGLLLGLIIVIFGFLIKIGAAPMHSWIPSVYDESPTIITIWLTIMPKISILIFITEIITQINFISTESIFFSSLTGSLIFDMKQLLLVLSLISLLVGSIVGLSQIKIKRLLAYSTISHIGFLLLALAINNEQSIDALLFYIVQYTFTNLNVFLILLALGYLINHNVTANMNQLYLKDINYLTEFTGLFRLYPLLSLFLTISLFSFAGIPPLIGFFSKQYVLLASIYAQQYFISFVAIIISVISAAYYLKIIRLLNKDTTPSVNNHPIDTAMDNMKYFTKHSLADCTFQCRLSNLHSYLIAVFTLMIVLFMFNPSILLNSTQLLALSLFNF